MSGFNRTGGNRRGAPKTRKPKLVIGQYSKYLHTDGLPAWRGINLRGRWSQEKLSRTGAAADERINLTLADIKRAHPELCNVPKSVTLIDDSNKWNRAARMLAQAEG